MPARRGRRLGVPLELAEYGRSILRGWWILLLCVAMGLGIAFFVTERTTPMYQGSVRFYVVSPSVTGQSALQSLELSRGRIASYASLVKSDSFIEKVAERSGTGLTASEVADSINASADRETLMLTVTVTQEDPAMTSAIVGAVATDFGGAVNELETGRTPAGAETVLNVVSGPTVGSEPVSPRVPLNLSLGALLGLAAGVVVVILRRILDRRVRTADEVEELTELPLLARVPFSTTAGKAARILERKSVSAVDDAARRLRTNIDFIPSMPLAEVIAITSAKQGEGKSTVALMLARAWAEAGENVLLVEANLHRPRLANDIRLAKSIGLSDVLAGHLPLDRVIQHTAVDGLHAVAAGTLSSHPTELLRGGGIVAVLDDMRSRYSRVIVDAPALQPLSDTALLAARVDGTLLVVRYGKVTPELLTESLRNLESVNTHATGVVLNALPARLSEGRRKFLRRWRLPGRRREVQSALTQRTPTYVPPTPTVKPNLPSRPPTNTHVAPRR